MLVMKKTKKKRKEIKTYLWGLVPLRKVLPKGTSRVGNLLSSIKRNPGKRKRVPRGPCFDLAGPEIEIKHEE